MHAFSARKDVVVSEKQRFEVQQQTYFLDKLHERCRISVFNIEVSFIPLRLNFVSKAQDLSASHRLQNFNFSNNQHEYIKLRIAVCTWGGRRFRGIL